MGTRDNILTKEDQSFRVHVQGRGQPLSRSPKRERYRWATSSEPGVFMLISKKELNIDGTYQRDEVSRGKVLEIARSWDWKLFGALSVVMRENGTLWIYDGGHRARASFYRDDIDALPCMVFESTIEGEAKAFIGANTMKSNVKAIHLYLASIKANEPLSLAVQAILSKYGYEVTNNCDKAYSFKAVAALKSVVEQDAPLAERVFSVCSEIAMDGELIPGIVISGLFFLAKKLSDTVDILSDVHKDKLKKRGVVGIGAAIKRETHIMGKGGATVAAKAILDLINQGKHRKIKCEF